MLAGNFFKNLNPKYKNHYFKGLSFNSAHTKKNDVFFAIRGTNLNGNKFIKAAIKSGAKIIVSNLKFQGIKNNILYIKSKNTRKLLSEVTLKIYKKKPKNLIAVTGTNGKSSIADFYFQILHLLNKKVASIGTLGIKTNLNNTKIQNTTLDPITLNKYLEKMKKININNVILEASSHGLKQYRLNGLDFKIGIFTNLTRDHLDYHRSYKDYLNSKLILFRHLLQKKSNVITDVDIPQYKLINKIAKNKELKIFTIGSKQSYLEIIKHNYKDNMQLVQIRYKKKIYNLSVNLIGKIQIKNLLMAMIAAEKSNIKFDKIAKLINKIKSVNGRMESIGRLKNNSKIILDYAHTPDALENCLQNLRTQFKNKKISIVFGCGGNRDRDKRSQMGHIANKFCNTIYLTDDNPRFESPKKIRSQIRKKINKQKLFEISDRKNAIDLSIKKLNSGEILLVAGRGHETKQDYGYFNKKFSDKEIILKSIKKKNKMLSANWKTNILNEEFKNFKRLNFQINKASINSKKIKKNDIFFAIKGKKKDGNFFIKEALKKGASCAVVNKIDNLADKSKQILVKDSLKSLINISKKIKYNSDANIIAVTGSCGKTSLKEMLGYVLGKIHKISYSPESYNNKYGVPLSLFNIGKNDDFGIFEIGMDKKGEINFLSKILKPNLGIITNISYAHFKNFKSINGIAKAKAEIINNISSNGVLVLNADDKFFEAHKKLATLKGIKVNSFSLKKKSANFCLNKIKKINNKFNIIVNINNKKYVYLMKSISKTSLQNMLASLATISVFKNVNQLSKNIFYNFEIPEGRGDVSKIKIKNKIIKLVDESYNANPLSVSSAIKNFDLLKQKTGKKNIILGDMLELGKHSKKLHQEIAKNINSSKIDRVYVYGKHIKHTFKKIIKRKKGLILRNKAQIINLIKNKINNNDYLMIKGSNATGLNEISKSLKKGNFYAI